MIFKNYINLGFSKILKATGKDSTGVKNSE